MPISPKTLRKELFRNAYGAPDDLFFKDQIRVKYSKGMNEKNQKYPPIVLTEFHLSSMAGKPIGLDRFTKGYEDRTQLRAEGVLWHAFCIIRRSDWISDWGWEYLLKALHPRPRPLIEECIKHGQIRVPLHGRVRNEPQYMNSFDVPFGLRLQADVWSVRNDYPPLQTEIDNTRFRWYWIASLNKTTYLRSRRYLHQGLIIHVIHELCTANKVLRIERSIEWLVKMYQQQWHARFGTDPTASMPLGRDILHHFALVWRYLADLDDNHGSNASYSSLPRGTWRLWGEEWEADWDELPDDHEAKLQNWGHWPKDWPEIDSENDPLEEEEEYVPLEQEENQEFLRAPSEEIPEPKYQQVTLRIPDKMRSHMGKRLTLPESLLWQCNVPPAGTEPRCVFKINFLSPSQEVLDMLDDRDRAYLLNGDWNYVTDKKFFALFRQLVFLHYMEHWKPYGQTMRDGRLTDLIDEFEAMDLST